LTWFRRAYGSIELIYFPDFDVPCADATCVSGGLSIFGVRDLRDQLVPHPCHLVDVADTLVARMKCGGACPDIDAPDVEEAIL
jgi:hypothetical protein